MKNDNSFHNKFECIQNYPCNTMISLPSLPFWFMSVEKGGIPACWGLHITYTFITSNLDKSMGLGLECKHQPLGVLLCEER